MMRFYNQQHRFYCGVDLHARTLAEHDDGCFPTVVPPRSRPCHCRNYPLCCPLGSPTSPLPSTAAPHLVCSCCSSAPCSPRADAPLLLVPRSRHHYRLPHFLQRAVGCRPERRCLGLSPALPCPQAADAPPCRRSCVHSAQ